MSEESTAVSSESSEKSELPEARRDRLTGPDADSRAMIHWLVVGVLLVVGVGLRVAVLAGDAGSINGDEAVAGLAGLDAWDGRLRTFYPGQDYGGALETWLVGVVVGLAGPSRAALKLVPMVLCAAGLFAVSRAAVPLVGKRAGSLGAAIAWTSPAALVWLSTRSWGFLWVAFCSVWIAVAMVAYLGSQDEGAGSWSRDRAPRWGALGLACGIGWWTTPLTMTVLVPALVWLAWRRLRELRGIALAVIGFLVGSAPWIRANVSSSFASLEGSRASDGQGYLEHLRELFVDALPTLMGLRTVYTKHWWAGRLGPLLYVLALAILVAGLVVLRRRAALLVAIVVTAPFLVALSPAGAWTGDARYLVYMWPAMVLVYMGLAFHLAARRGWTYLPAVVVVGALVLTGAGWEAIGRDTQPRVAPGVETPIDLDPVIAELEARGVSHAWAHYWLAYRLAFESDGTLIATPRDVVRFPEMLDAVREAPAVAYVVVDGTDDAARTETALECSGIGYQRVEVGEVVLFLPADPIAPEALDAACG